MEDKKIYLAIVTTDTGEKECYAFTSENQRIKWMNMQYMLMMNLCKKSEMTYDEFWSDTELTTAPLISM